MRAPGYYTMRSEGVSPFAAPDPQPRETPSPCRRGCCWTPFGHSTVRDDVPPTSDKACHCHDAQRRSRATEHQTGQNTQPPKTEGNYS